MEGSEQSSLETGHVLSLCKSEIGSKYGRETDFWTVNFGYEVDTRGSDIDLKGQWQRRTIQS